jgi:hypothetical protein
MLHRAWQLIAVACEAGAPPLRNEGNERCLFRQSANKLRQYSCDLSEEGAG